MTSHCETCLCDDHSALHTFNVRCQRLSRGTPVFNPIEIPPRLAERLSDGPRYRFGFREFLPDVSTSKLVGAFFAAVHLGPKPPAAPAGSSVWEKANYDIALKNWRAGTRYFGVLIPHPHRWASAPFEYTVGDAFDIGDGYIHGEDLEQLGTWPDDLILNWLDRSRLLLREFVLSRVLP